ncbi:MAG TPA: hypothetical protein VGL20_20685 [Candidatus Dormibacteraeota bacterium]|jgi:hypothetical protein
MYMPSPYESLVRGFFEAVSGDRLIDMAPRLCARQVTLHVSGASPLAGDYRGIDAVTGGYFDCSRRGAPGGLHYEVSLVRVDGGVARALTRLHAVRRQHVLDVEQMGTFRLGGGKIQEIWLEPEDQGEFDAFFARHVDMGGGHARAT